MMFECRFCGETVIRDKSKPRPAAFMPFGYTVVSPQIFPTWQKDGSVKFRVRASYDVDTNIRRNKGVIDIVCESCWKLFMATDAICEATGIDLLENCPEDEDYCDEDCCEF